MNLSSNLERIRNKILTNAEQVHCPIWGNFANNECWTRRLDSRDMYTYWSPKAGGGFSLSGSIADVMDSYLTEAEHKIVLSKWILKKNLIGIIPDVLSNDIANIINRTAITSSQKLIDAIIAHSEIPARQSVGLWNSGQVFAGSYEGKLLAMTYTSCSDLTDYQWLVEAAVSNGDLQHWQNNIRVTPDGLTKIEQEQRVTQSNQAFVAMWFDESVDNVYDNAIKIAISSAGYLGYRVDRDRTHSDQITNKILAEIKNSKFLIADFTHDENGARGGVYFEAGYAMGLGIPVIWAIRKDEVSKMHFDTNHYPHIVWETEEQLRKELEAAIIAHQHIGRGPL